MALSPYETEVLTAIEEGLRDEDPVLAATLDRTSSTSVVPFHSPVPIRHALLLLGALTGLVTVHTAFAEQLGVVGLAVLTFVAVVPWLVATVRSAERRSPNGGDRDERGSEVVPRPVGRGALLAAASVLMAVTLVPDAGHAIAAFVLTLVVAGAFPRLVLRVVERFEESRGSHPRGPSA